MGQKMKNAPVYFTIAQVRFNPVLSMESFLPAIQERFRKEQYPDFKRNIFASFSFNAEANIETSQPIKNPVSRYSFSNMEGTWGFLLEEGALSLQTTEHDVFETLSTEFFRGLDIVYDSVPGGINFSERIGLRYLDAIYPKLDEKLNLFLTPEVMGLSEKVDGNVKHSFSETVIERDEHTVIARVLIQGGPVGFPPDLNPIGLLNLAERFKKLEGVHALVDTDAFYVKREIFDGGSLKNRLDRLYLSIKHLFEMTVTPFAIKSWK